MNNTKSKPEQSSTSFADCEAIKEINRKQIKIV